MDKALRAVVILTVVFPVWLIVSPSRAQDAGKTIIRVRGANTMATMIDRLATAYGQTHREGSVVVSGGGMQEGLQALFGKTANVVMASRKTNAQEKQLAAQKGIQLVEQLVGWDAIVIIVHPTNPVKELTVEQVRKVFSGEYTDWHDLGGEFLQIVLYGGDAARSGMAEFFNDTILQGVPPTLNARRYYPSVIKDVSARVDAAGYVPLALALAAHGQGIVRTLAIKKDADSPAILPSHETIESRTYPLPRPLFLCYDGNSSEKQIKQFVEFCAEKCMSLR